MAKVCGRFAGNSRKTFAAKPTGKYGIYKRAVSQIQCKMDSLTKKRQQCIVLFSCDFSFNARITNRRNGGGSRFGIHYGIPYAPPCYQKHGTEPYRTFIIANLYQYNTEKNLRILILQSRVYRFAFKSQHTEYTFVYFVKRFFFHKAFQTFHSQSKLSQSKTSLF